MRPRDLYDLVWALDPRLSPDGKTVAVVARTLSEEDNAYPSAVWLVPVDGSSPPRKLTAGGKADVDPRFSPDGTQIAFTSNRDGKQRQLYVLPIAGGEARKLTELDEDVTDVAWSPDGARIAFNARVPAAEYEEEDERARAPRRFSRLQYKLDNEGWIGDRRRHLFVVPADGSAPPTQLTDGDFEDKGAAWSPDGKWIAFGSARQDTWDIDLRRDIYVIDAEGGEPQRLSKGDSWHQDPAWSPDGTQIACQWQPGGVDHPRHGQVAVLDAKTGDRRILTGTLDRNAMPYPPIREPAWDGSSIVFGIEDGGNNHVYRVAADGSGMPELLVGGELRATGWDARGGVLVHTATTVTLPGELFSGGQQLTEFGREFCAKAELAEAERFKAGDVDAWIMRPPGFEAGKRYPVLLTIHGGPFTQYGNGFYDEAQIYAGAGYVVLMANPRGSSGYSEEWGRAVVGPLDGGPGWGSVDYDDLMAVVDTALDQYEFCDPERLGVLGGSYGGYMTSWMISHTDRFRAACSERAVNHLLSEFGSTDIPWLSKAYMGVFPFEDPKPYLDQSPAAYADKIQTPVLILHSERDLRCNIEQGEHLFHALRVLQRDVEMVRFPGEGHELTRSGSPRHRVSRFEILLDWFARKLY